MIKTELCKLLDIEHPIIQGGMAWIATGELAAAVSQAGGLGIIGAGNAPAEIVREEIKKVKKVTDKPFGVNVMLLSPYVDEVIEVVIEEKVPVVTTGAGNPGKYIDALKDAGTKIIPVVPSVALAKRMARLGVDAIIAEGSEAGGHIGELTTMPLIPQIARSVDLPVIAAGGVADGYGLAAVLSLGAVGAQVGTRFICAKECTVHENYKKAILKARDRDAIVTARSTGHPVRNLKNKLTRQIESMEQEGVPKEEIEKLGIGRLQRAVIDGDVDEGTVMAGQVAAMVSKVEPAKDIIVDIIEGAKKVMKDNCKLIV
ncbi:enoyl-[acyl-carrier protein] reductase II [Orenia metallireducens]|uniref:Probable nitronate monooxygenase n=1 Tax=Orenia metallireducens TaxID=1413210 RepID=A0A285HFN4_9FIRM|nr:enoyl-[acyl-carrier-protein] reductase FabK [Orenia metallireducens]PRX27454.1 enoyl-[acyl-carrier protein] reductase II [Orenia metallireducens]SNY34540.1 enoyl-[acyl-carrier protein] reductase II [Orenia metallireducens]